MTEDELRRAYDALRHRRREQAPRTGESKRPTPEEIWGAVSDSLEPGERVRILDEALRAGASDEVALAHSLHTAARDAATANAVKPIGASRFQRWGALAAAATILIVAGVPLWQRTRTSATALDDDASRYRSGNAATELLLVTPTADEAVSADGRFVWHALQQAQRYQLEAIDSTGKTVATVTTTDTTATLPTDVTSADRKRIAGWWVTATMNDGSSRRSELSLIGSPRRP